MRAFLPVASLLCLLLASCSKPEVRPPGAFSKVVVVVGSRVDSLPTNSYREEMMGEGNPRTVLATQAQAALRDRGFEVVGQRIVASPYPLTQDVVQMVKDNEAQAAVVVVLTWVDVSAIDAVGRADVSLDTLILSPEGNVAWRNQTTTTASVGLYQAQTDYRSYLRNAVIQAIQQIP